MSKPARRSARSGLRAPRGPRPASPCSTRTSVTVSPSSLRSVDGEHVVVTQRHGDLDQRLVRQLRRPRQNGLGHGDLVLGEFADEPRRGVRDVGEELCERGPGMHLRSGDAGCRALRRIRATCSAAEAGRFAHEKVRDPATVSALRAGSACRCGPAQVVDQRQPRSLAGIHGRAGHAGRQVARSVPRSRRSLSERCNLTHCTPDYWGLIRPRAITKRMTRCAVGTDRLLEARRRPPQQGARRRPSRLGFQQELEGVPVEARGRATRNSRGS